MRRRKVVDVAGVVVAEILAAEDAARVVAAEIPAAGAQVAAVVKKFSK